MIRIGTAGWSIPRVHAAAFDVEGSHLERYARRSPATVGAAAVVAGFILARFIKSSAESLAQANAAATSAPSSTGPCR